MKVRLTPLLMTPSQRRRVAASIVAPNRDLWKHAPRFIRT